MSFFGPNLRDLGELWAGQNYVYQTRTDGAPVEPEPSRTVPDDPFKPHDDPQSPRPSPLAGAWQCPGCGRIYSMFVNSCGCQMRHFVTSSSTTFKLYPTLPSEMP